MESTIGKELAALKSCLKIHKVDSLHLQVPFPPLNKTLPPQHVKHSPTGSSKEAVVESTKPSVVETNTSPKDDVKDKTAGSSGGANKAVIVRGDPSPSRPPVSALSIDWGTLAKQLITVLEKAVHARVVRAPHLPSSTQKTSVISSASLGDRQKTESTSVLGMESRHGQSMEPSVCGTKLDAKKGDLNIMYGRVRIAILFSGGVDSMLLAVLTDR